MKRQLESLATVLLFGVSVLGLGAAAGAQQAPPASQQPMEIPPMQYPPQGGPQAGPPPGYGSQGGPAPGYGAQAGPPPGYPQQQGQTDPGAARISFIQGDVSTQHSDSGEWVAATLNTPVVSGDHVSTGDRSRAEIQLDHANILRMSDQSTANIVNLSPTEMQLQIGQGLANFDVLKGSETDVDIQTPNVEIHPQAGEGSFRILVNSDGETIVDVRKGSAEISTPQGSTRVERNQRITIQGNADDAQYQVSGAPASDGWDKWNNDRDHMVTSAESWQHTNPYYTGSQDLDPYGQWENVPDYGSVWFPTADAGWAPYRDGRWVFEPYYGWTWVSYEPWGWAPYHYGRWFVYGGNWGWWPGPVYGGYHPIWAPAYVSFLGFGGRGWGVSLGFGFGGGFGSVGWLPIGPGDRFYPWYGRGVSRVNAVNVYNIHDNRGGFAPLRGDGRGFSNVDRAFTDEHVRAGVSSMASDQFGRGRVPMQQQRLDAGTFRQASVMTGANPVSPSRESFRPSDRQVSSNAIPNRATTNQRFFSNSRQGVTSQSDRGPAGLNRSGDPSIRQPQQNNVRPGFQSFGSGNSGNVNRGPGGTQVSRPPQEYNQSQRGFTPQSPQQAPPGQSSGPGWRTFSGPSRETQPNSGGRTYQAPNGVQSRPSYSPPESARQYPSYSRGGSGNSGYARPPLNMQQPVVTPRGSYSAPPPAVRSAPSGGSSGGGYRGGGSSGGSSHGGGGGSSRGGSSSSGGGHSSGHDRH